MDTDFPQDLPPPMPWWRLHALKLVAAAGLLTAAGVAWLVLSHVSPQEYWERAQALQRGGDYKAAVIELKNALEEHPDPAAVREALGKALYLSGEASGAEKELLKVRELGRDTPEISLFLARAQIALGKYPEAASQTEQLAGASRDQKAALLALRALARLAAEDFGGAEEVLAEAEGWAPGHPEILYVRSQLALQRGDLHNAMTLVESALSGATRPSTLLAPDLWARKGDILRRQDRPAEAASAYQEALKQAPGHIPVVIAAIETDLALERLDHARTLLDKLKALAPGNLNGLYLDAMLAYRRGRHADAYGRIQQMLRSAPDHVPSLLLAAAAGIALDKQEEARTRLTRVLETHPEHVGARKMLAALELRQGKLEDARFLLDTLRDDPRDMTLASLKGDIALRQGDFAEARRNLERLDGSDAALKLAASEAGLGHRAEALVLLEKQAREDQKSGRADYLLINEYIKGRQYPEALAAADRFAAKAKMPALGHNLRGVIHRVMGERAQARADFQKALQADPRYRPALTNLANLEIEEKHPEAARELLLKALAEGEDVSLRLALAGLASARRAWGEYQGHLEKAKLADPKAMEPRRLLIQHWLSRENPGRALTEAHEAQNVHKHEDFAYLIGYIMIRQGDLMGAESYHARWLRDQPESAAAHTGMALTLMGKGDTGEAIQHLDEALALRPDFLPALNARKFLMSRGDSKVDVATLLRQLDQPPESDAAVRHRDALALLQQKKYREAVEIYRGLLRAQPQDPIALNNLAWALAELKDPGALAAAEQAYRAAPDTPSNLDTYAWALHLAGQSGKALPLLDKAHRLASGNRSIHWHYAAVLAATGDKTRARTELERLLAGNPPIEVQTRARKLLEELGR